MPTQILEFSARVDKGKLVLSDRPAFIAAISSLDGKDIKLIVKQQTRTRTLSQNNLLWQIYTVISHDTGNTPQELHDIFKAMFLAEQVNFKGRWLTVPKSTTVLSTSEFSNYVDNIIRCAAEMGIYIPENGEIYE